MQDTLSAILTSIGDVERETGLSKDTLRIWERRYGFPQPTRDENDERVYPADQVEKLRVIRRLMDSGLRPGKIVGLSLEELNACYQTRSAADCSVREDSAPLLALLQLVKLHQPEELHERLMQMLLPLGLRRFILDVVVPLNALVGIGWVRGTVEIFEEHLYTAQVQTLLQHAIGSLPKSVQPPRVLLTTLPGEEHQLGTLMARAFIAMEGAQCISLGIQTPLVEIIKAIEAHAVDILGLSVVAADQPRLAWAQVSYLRSNLASRVQLWIGGSGAQAARIIRIAGLRRVISLTEIPAAIAEWRAARGAGAPP